MREEFEASETRMQALNPLLRSVRLKLGAVQHELFFGDGGGGKSGGPLLDGACVGFVFTGPLAFPCAVPCVCFLCRAYLPYLPTTEVFTRVDQVLEIVGDDLVLREGNERPPLPPPVWHGRLLLPSSLHAARLYMGGPRRLVRLLSAKQNNRRRSPLFP